MRRLGLFFFLFKFLNFFFFFFFFLVGGGGGVQKYEYFLGMKIFWIFLGDHYKIGLVLGLRVFS